MLLIAGIKSEDPTRLVIESAENAGVPFLFLDQLKLNETDFKIHLTNRNFSAELYYENLHYNLFDFAGVYYRFIESPVLNDKKVFYNLRLFDFWLETANCRVMNKSSKQISNISKPYQCQLIASSGFQIPPTLITNDPHLVQSFKKKYKRVIYKSISSIRSVVCELNAIRMLDINKVKFLPSQFQQLLSGKNIRVHVVGNEIFASEITTEAIDYRYASHEDLHCEIKEIELDDETRERCFTLSSILGLPLCGIDLMITENGTYCFEVNPSPGFSYYQRQTGQDISGAIIRYLSEKKQ